MRKVTTINLNHNACQVEEEAFELLRQYLDDAERALAGNPDRAEVMADLEQAIADKCRLALGPYKSVVSEAQIRTILQEMGPVEGGNASAAEPASDATGTASSPTSSAPRPRRLYRILDGEKWTLTGVCNGLAAYAAVQRDWVRVAFVLLTVFTGGMWLIVYFALVFLMPVATTPEELAAAHGRPFNAQEVVDSARRQSADHRAERQARRMRRQHRWYGQPAVAHGPPPGPTARIAGGVLLPVLTLLSAAWFAAMLLVALLVWDSLQLAGPRWQGSWEWNGLPHWLALAAVLAGYLLIALPIAAGRRTALYYANGGRPHGWASAWSGLLWVVVVAVALLAAWQLVPQLQVLLQERLGWPAPLWRTHWI